MCNMFKPIIYIILIALIFSSCHVLRPNLMFEVDDDYVYESFVPSEKEYILKPFDKLSIRITTNDGFKLIDLYDEMNSSNNLKGLEYLIEYDGLIKVPTLGRIPISDYTIREAEKELEKQYSQFYQNPFVQIRVVNRKVYLFKEGGEKANVINIPDENITLIEAIAESGGLSNIDKSYRIKLVRGDITNNPKVYIYDIYALENLKETNILLQADDIIYVESRAKYANRFMGEMAPYLTLFSTVLLIIGLMSL